MKTATRMADAIALIPDGASLMFGGFMAVGTPERLFDAIVAAGKRNLTIIGNDTARPGLGVGKLISAGCVSRAIVSHIGANPETQAKMIAGEIQVDLTPQGTLAERIRAGGCGLGGILTKTGLGTLAAEGKEVVTVDGEDYLLEKPLRADFALVHAQEVDWVGNLRYSLTAHNFNPIICMAADTVIVDAEVIVPVGVIAPDAVKTPGILVDHIIERAA